MRILITNNTLGPRAGSELYVRDLALALMKRGHNPVAYSTVLGEVAEELRRATVPVIDDLAQLGAAPDLIHGQHHLETMTAALHFPDTPAVFLCHGWAPWEELPPLAPSILRHVAVDELCRERLLTTGAIPAERIEVLLNFVDLERFPRRGPLPERPQSALVFSNYAGDGPMLAAIRAACARAGVGRVDVVGGSSGNAAPRPEDILGAYDLVFAKAKCALEALACGCAVIVADFSGLAGMVDTANLDRLRSLNFGVRAMQAAPVTEEGVLRELARFDAADARLVSERVRREADLSLVVDRWLAIYAEVLDEWRGLRQDPGLCGAELRAASRYVRFLAPALKTRQAADQLARQAADAQTALAEHAARLTEHAAALAAQVAGLSDRLAEREAELAHILGSRAWKAVTRYRALRAWLCRR